MTWKAEHLLSPGTVAQTPDGQLWQATASGATKAEAWQSYHDAQELEHVRGTHLMDFINNAFEAGWDARGAHLAEMRALLLRVLDQNIVRGCAPGHPRVQLVYDIQKVLGESA